MLDPVQVSGAGQSSLLLQIYSGPFLPSKEGDHEG